LSTTRKTVALIAHDNKKDDMLAFAHEHRDVLMNYHLIATGTTGKLLNEKTGLSVERMLSGPIGGDAQIAARVAEGRVAAVSSSSTRSTSTRTIPTSTHCCVSATSMTCRWRPTHRRQSASFTGCWNGNRRGSSVPTRYPHNSSNRSKALIIIGVTQLSSGHR